ncbi:MAG: hypothetical protein KJ936_02925, partial [Proteobacteria bacterium]|nr:hypothetical protein [Pseudomonadota bacterium]
MRNDKEYLHELLDGGEFRLSRLDLPDIDNEPVIRVNVPEIAEQEICLFHRSVADAPDYLKILHDYIKRGLEERTSAPVVRFADGEYAFYRFT